MKLYTAILAASLFMYVGVRNGTGERVTGDTTIPKYRYIFKLELGAEMLDRILYVQDSLMTHWGVEKGTTESNNAKLLYFNYSNYIRRSLKLDSVKIENKKP